MATAQLFLLGLVAIGAVLVAVDGIVLGDVSRRVRQQRDHNRTRIVGRSSLRAWTRVTLCCRDEKPVTELRRIVNLQGESAYVCRDPRACQRGRVA